jgi:nucleoside-diphosphate-sugar epimerase
MNIFIIGGTGFLGSYLLPELSMKHHLTVLTRSREKGEKLQNEGIDFLLSDLSELEKLSNKVREQDMVIYMAMPPIKMGRMSTRFINHLKSEITKYLKNTVGFARKHKAVLILTAGTSFHTSGDEVADESWPIKRFGMTVIGEYYDQLVAELDSERSLPFIQMLPAQIYGPGGLFKKILDMNRKGRNVVFGSGRNKIPRIHVEDCANAYAKVIERIPLYEKFIIADDMACTNYEFNSYLGMLFNNKKPRKIPGFILKMALGKYVYETMMMDCRVANEKAKRKLAWKLKYPTYMEGLKATVEAYLKKTL